MTKRDAQLDLRVEFRALVQEARLLSTDIGREVEDAVRTGLEQPLDATESERLLERVLLVLREGARARGDERAARDLAQPIEALIEHVNRVREDLTYNSSPRVTFELIEHNGIVPRPVRPSPVFHGISVPMREGYVRTVDVPLWEENERLQIHLGQFRKQNARGPTQDELLEILLSKADLPGTADFPDVPARTVEDQFEIAQLARSIAVNGLRKPPILDTDGTLLDGNRRVTACHYIMLSDEFTAEQKRAVEHIVVQQLTEHATEDQSQAVVVSLNFEPDCKQDWPEYVKARKVYEEWQAVLAAQPRQPGQREQAKLKRELSQKFALGPDASTVTRYLKMMEWVLQFEDHHTTKRDQDEFVVQHRANRYFQYFDELSKGVREGGVSSTLQRDDVLREWVLDLLFDGKFRTWKQIRDLKRIANNEEARDLLRKARDEDDAAQAEEFIDQAIAIVRTRDAESRMVGLNTRIETFVQWLEDLPVRAFREVKPASLRGLLRALRLVEKYIEGTLQAE